MLKFSHGHLKWFALLLSSILLFAACSQKGGLRPLEPTVVSNEIIGGQPQLLTFPELEADPNLYRDKLIRVTGSYISLPVVACAPYSGPNPAWSMVADDLRLDTLGFEGLLFRLAEPETTLTVDGVLRRYDGPLGCGKRPSAGVLWYLEALQIVQPNPLVLAKSDLGGTGVVPPPFPTGTPPAPAIEETPEPEPTTGPGTPSRTPTPTSTVNLTMSATPTIDANETGTPTPTPTPTRTQTPPPGGTAPVATATPTSTRTPIPPTTSSPPATAPPGGGGGGGYPGVTNTPYP